MPTDPRIAELTGQLEQLQEADQDRLSDIAVAYTQAKKIAETAGKLKTAFGKDLLEAMAEQGLTSVGVGPVKVVISTKTPLGVAEGDDAEHYLDNLEAVRSYVEEWNPTTTPTTVTAIKQARDAELAQVADAPLPDFLVENEVTILSVRKNKND